MEAECIDLEALKEGILLLGNKEEEHQPPLYLGHINIVNVEKYFLKVKAC